LQYFNPLIALPSPRDLPLVAEAMSKITKYDKLWVKYSPEYITYPIIRDEFLKPENKNKYTHLVICPDDLLIDDPKKLDFLLEDSQMLGEEDKTIMSGYCNVDTTDNAIYANVTAYDVSSTRHGRIYQWFTLKQLEEIKSDFLIPVKFSGFALMVIPRSAIEQIPFRNDSSTGVFDALGCCVDVMFCNDAISKGYKIYVDSRVRLQHLKQNDIHTSALLQQYQKPQDEWKFYYEYRTT
jgi:hypothetical protein